MARFGDSAVLGRRWQELEVQCEGCGHVGFIGSKKTRRFLVFRLSLVGVLVVDPELVLLGSCCQPTYVI